MFPAPARLPARANPAANRSPGGVGKLWGIAWGYDGRAAPRTGGPRARLPSLPRQPARRHSRSLPRQPRPQQPWRICRGTARKPVCPVHTHPTRGISEPARRSSRSAPRAELPPSFPSRVWRWLQRGVPPGNASGSRPRYRPGWRPRGVVFTGHPSPSSGGSAGRHPAGA